MTTTSATVPDILSVEHDVDPQPGYRYLRDEAPVVYHAGSDSWLVTRHEDVQQLLRGHEVSSQNYATGAGLIFGRTLLEMDGKEHQRHRVLINPIFQAAGIENVRPTIMRVVSEQFLPHLETALAAVRRGESVFAEIDLVPTYFGQLPIGVIEIMLDLPRDHHEKFTEWYTAMHAFTGNVSGDPEVDARGRQASSDMSDYMLPIIAERRAHPTDDLISRMCLVDIDGEALSDEGVVSFARLMVTAGGETTDRALGLTMLNLLQHPDQLAAVRENRSLIDNAFVETLRYSAPVAFSGRRAEVDIEMHGVTIPQGATINLLLAAANRDPRKFSEPDRFDIFRSDNDVERGFSGVSDHLGFLKGRHHCVGAQLARAEIQTALNVIFDNMNNLRLAEGFVPKPTGLWTRGVNSLVVAFTPVR
jgi:cytochrome P450